MTPQEVGALMKRARGALQQGTLRPTDICVLDCLVFRCSAPGMRQTSVSLAKIAKLICVCKDTVIASLARIMQAGLLRRHKTRVLVRWSLGVASRQGVNRYEFLPPATGSTPSTVIRELGTSRDTTVVPVAKRSLLETVLDRLRVGQRPATVRMP